MVKVRKTTKKNKMTKRKTNRRKKTARSGRKYKGGDNEVTIIMIKAIEENIEAARKSGNKLTQTLDVDGNLVGVNTMNFDDREMSSTSGREEHEANVISKLNK